MVRLVVNEHLNAENARVCFNSYMVRLVDQKIKKQEKLQPRFNSYMVRLVAISKDEISCLNTKFQFLYGAIGGTAYSYYQTHLKSVSIPIWCDWWQSVTLCLLRHALFQFLYGAIGGEEIKKLLGAFGGFNSYMVRLVA